ncbi:UbiA family prenyltransferase [Salinifilum ghardaiensis]
MLRDNTLVTFVPHLVFLLGACAVHGTPVVGVAWGVLALAVLTVLFGYTFEAANQAFGVDEDRVNKPHRPVPQGLTTPRGLLFRYAVATPLYTLAGWVFGVLPWVLVWQVVTVLVYLVLPQRWYFCFKNPSTMIAAFVQLAISWELVAPLDRFAVTWILVAGVGWTVALHYEDVRDMDGDRAAGRRTFPLLIGAWPVRIWFTAVLLVLPMVQHMVLWASSGAGLWRILLADALVFVPCWVSAYRSLRWRGPRADAVTYQVYCTVYGLGLLQLFVLYI